MALSGFEAGLVWSTLRKEQDICRHYYWLEYVWLVTSGGKNEYLYCENLIQEHIVIFV